MQQYETSHAGTSSVPGARWHGCKLYATPASAASVSVTPVAGYHAIAQVVLYKVMQESK